MDVRMKEQFAELVTATCRRAFIVPSTPATGRPSTMLMLDLPARSSNQGVVAERTCELFMQDGQAPVVLVKLSLGGLVLGIAFNPLCFVMRDYLRKCTEASSCSFNLVYLGCSDDGHSCGQGLATHCVEIDLFSKALELTRGMKQEGAAPWKEAVVLVMADFLLEQLQRQVDGEISECRFFIVDECAVMPDDSMPA